MVRLFVPEGEGQHALTRRRPGALAAQIDLISTPFTSALVATGLTGLFALVGRSQPGTYLKTVAYLSVFNLSTQACSLYGRHELNKGVFKMEGVEPRSGRLWERTKHWTMEDATLGGGVLGMFLALNPRALPGVYGWKRFLGAATVGMGFGYKVSEPFIGRVTPQMLSILHRTDQEVQRREYEKLQQNQEAKQSLSRFGKIALWWHTDPRMRILRNPLQLASSRNGEVTANSGGGHVQTHHSSPIDEMDQSTVMQLEFRHGELQGPDMEDGYRTYKQDLKNQSEDEIMEWIDKAKESCSQNGGEFQWLWLQLATREAKLESVPDNTPGKDIMRRELQLLNNLANDLWAKTSVWVFLLKDAQKRLKWIQQNKAKSSRTTVVSEKPDSIAESPRTDIVAPKLLAAHNREYYEKYHAPHMTAELIRLHWSRQKELLGQIEHGLTQYNALAPEEGTHLAENHKQLKTAHEQMAINLKATEKLLEWCEQRVRDAEDNKRIQLAAGDDKLPEERTEDNR